MCILNKKSRAGFTLLELVVVIIIIGVLATLGVANYSKTVEKYGRSKEAWQMLNAIRAAQEDFYIEKDRYADNWQELGFEAPGECNPNYFFKYGVSSGMGEFKAWADRCAVGSGGKSPVGNSYHLQITVDSDGTVTKSEEQNWGDIGPPIPPAPGI